ncbi:type I-B CRISPR-associated protein Cas5b [Deinococcus sp.]|uniref:type I-B CRISPR-associated protein Cas5b n=1 Tax=Deinococcus sp. TaxID=47478 RepID=UPI003B5BB195
MRVLKIELEGVTTSFRYPHLLTGRQPSYPLPPPATLYGHIASVLGDYPAPDSFRFAYTFTHQGSVDDYEHTWLIERDERKAKKGQPAPNITAGLSPTLRQVLFRPRLTLYLDTPHLDEWQAAFRSPTYPVALGRSQDLAAYTGVELVTLEERQTGYLEHTLLPWDWRPLVSLGQGVLMPRLIDPENRQRVVWARYVALTHRVFLPMHGESGREAQWVRIEPESRTVWVDPHTEERQERQRALIWHTLNGEDSEALHVPA